MSNRDVPKSKRRKQTYQGTQKAVQREHKDRLFRLIFQNKRDLLDLYNAVNDTNYENPADLEITTIEDVMYLSMKNDLSFVLGVTMNLYEHQSTWNENMPLRGFFYFAELYQKYLKKKKIKLTDEKRRVMLPFPKYVVFYNGTMEVPDRVELKLSDCFMQTDRDEEPCLECKAIVLNINAGHNDELMRKCRRLSDYSIFIEGVRWFMSEGCNLDESVERSMKYCIRKGILSDILTERGLEVYRMILTEYDELEEREYLRNEGRKAGLEAGRQEGLKEGRTEGRTEMLTEMILERLEVLGMPAEEVKRKIQETADEAVLKSWYKLSCSVGSAEEFAENM